MSRKSLSRFIIFMMLLIVFGLSVSFLLRRSWKRRLMQNETKVNAQEAPVPELLPVKEEDKNWQRDLPLRRRYEKLAELYNAEMQRLVAYYGRLLKGSERENFFAEQSIFLAERSRESRKELSKDKTGVEENLDYLKKYIALTKARCSGILERISNEGGD